MRSANKQLAASAGTSARIYVQIPAYRDSELVPTLLDLYSKAARPELLRVAVLWQRERGEILPADVKRLPNLELTEVPFTASQGCNWARSLLQKGWRNEPFTLLLDSHHRFVRDWDQKLIDLHSELIASGVKRPLITAYLPNYNPMTHPAGKHNRPFKIYPWKWEQGLLIHLTSFPLLAMQRRKGPIPADFISMHFVFTRGRFNQDVPCDPQIYFTGDEVAMSLRAFTHGYDLFHPDTVIAWHSYNRQTRITHWSDHAEWHLQHAKALRRLRSLFTGRLRGRFGAGKLRSTRKYEQRLSLPLVAEAE
jgi:hypothetical protein